MTIAITARLFLNGSYFKDIIVRNDIGEIAIEVLSEIPTKRVNSYANSFPLKIIHFKQAYYSENKFYAWGVPKQIEDLLRAEEKKKKNIITLRKFLL